MTNEKKPAAESKGTGHPLFPRDEDGEADTRDISWIHVTRDGAFHARRFVGADLVDLSQIYDRFGGGSYELIGKNESGQRITARKSYRLEGPSKPLNAEAPTPGAPPPQAAPPASNEGGSMMAALVTAILAGQQQANAQNMQFAGMMVQAMGGFAQTMIAAKDKDAGSLISAMAEMSKSNTAVMSEALRSAAGKSDGGGAEVLAQGIEIGQALTQGKEEPKSEFQSVVEGVIAASNAANGKASVPAS